MKKIIYLCLPVFLLMAFTVQNKINVTSTAFAANGMIPVKYSCQGTEVSPPLIITNIPAGAKSLAIIFHDPDAPHPGGITHWVAWNIPLSGQIPENFKGGQQGQNSDNKSGYKGMCPPDGVHHYNFKVYALDILLQLSKDTDKPGLEAAMQGHIVGQGELTGLYGKTN
jgi:Raf kinase inhibitor-like YbhB/YbcL family protein